MDKVIKLHANKADRLKMDSGSQIGNALEPIDRHTCPVMFPVYKISNLIEFHLTLQ